MGLTYGQARAVDTFMAEEVPNSAPNHGVWLPSPDLGLSAWRDHVTSSDDRSVGFLHNSLFLPIRRLQQLSKQQMAP